MKWIPVWKDRPEFNVDVLATDGKSRFVAFMTDGIDDYNWFVCRDIVDGITHWTPLPDLPGRWE
jgi:hypothetical protein